MPLPLICMTVRSKQTMKVSFLLIATVLLLLGWVESKAVEDEVQVRLARSLSNNNNENEGVVKRKKKGCKVAFGKHGSAAWWQRLVCYTHKPGAAWPARMC